jgi:hypothetical protein
MVTTELGCRHPVVERIAEPLAVERAPEVVAEHAIVGPVRRARR